MTARILIECGAAETRAAFVDDGVVTHLWFGPARGDEMLATETAASDIVAGRVTSVSKSLSAVFVDIGAAREGFLPIRKGEKPPIEGARALFSVHRPPIGEKGAVLSSDWRKGLSEADVALLEKKAATGAVGMIGETLDAAASAFHSIRAMSKGAVADVIVNDPTSKRLLEAAGAGGVLLERQSFAENDVDGVIEESLASIVALPGGARLIFQETAAGAVIDVDTASAGEGGGARLNDKVNVAAAARILLDLSRRSLGGRVIIDFLPPTNAQARSALVETMKTGLKRFDGARFGRIAPDGLCDFTLPRRRRSLLEEASEPVGADWPVAGRRFTLDWSAKAAIRALESALGARPSSQFRLAAAADIVRYLERERPQWRNRLAQKYGARFDIIENETLKSGTYDLAE